MPNWIEVCRDDELECEEVRRFDNSNKTFALYRNAEGIFYCTDGLCTHEEVHLADGLVFDNTIECPKHGAIFDITTGNATRLPACVDLKTYAVKINESRVLVNIE